jgi:hypothetical protein
MSCRLPTPPDDPGVLPDHRGTCRERGGGMVFVVFMVESFHRLSPVSPLLNVPAD